MEIKNIILGIAIMILTIFVAVYGMSIFYPAPEYNDYCPEVQMAKMIVNEAECINAGGKWNPYEEIRSISDETGYCDISYYCRQDYEVTNKIRTKKIFYISIPLGIIFLVIGGFLFYLDVVGAGLMGGGVGTIIYGAGNYWQYGDDLFRFIISLLGLTAVIGLTYWFNKKHKKKR